MPQCFRHLILSLVIASGPAHAGLPSDADRSIDVELAGFLYSQGVYKKRAGPYSALTGASKEIRSQNDDERIRFPKTAGSSDAIAAWIESTDHKIEFKELIEK